MATKTVIDLVLEQVRRERDAARSNLVARLEWLQGQIGRDLGTALEGREPSLGWIDSVVEARIAARLMRDREEMVRDITSMLEFDADAESKEAR